jgi:dynein heavy chain 1
MNRAPTSRSQLYFLLAWFHAIVQERVQCVPYGFTKYYEFTDTHRMIALDAIDYWVENVPKVQSGLFVFVVVVVVVVVVAIVVVAAAAVCC